MKLSEKLSDTAKLRIANMLLEQLENAKRSHITECEGDDGNMYFHTDRESLDESCNACTFIVTAIEEGCIADGVTYHAE